MLRFECLWFDLFCVLVTCTCCDFCGFGIMRVLRFLDFGFVFDIFGVGLACSEFWFLVCLISGFEFVDL